MNENQLSIVSLLLGIFIEIMIGFLLGRVVIELSLREEAIEAKVAEYYIDTDHNRAFRWIKPGGIK